MATLRCTLCFGIDTTVHLSGEVIGKDEELATHGDDLLVTKRDIPSDEVGDINQVRDLRTA